MAIKQFNTFAADSGITKVTSNGSVTVTGGVVQSQTTTGGNWTGCGWYSSSGVTAVADDIVFMKVKKSATALNNCMWGIQKVGTGINIDASNDNYINLFFSGGTAAGYNFGSSFAVSADTYYDLKFVIGAASIEAFARPTGDPSFTSYGSVAKNWIGQSIFVQNTAESNVSTIHSTDYFYITDSTGLPDVPTGLTASPASFSSVSVSWDTVLGADTYTLYRDGSPVVTQAGLTYTDTGLSGGTEYAYTVLATTTALGSSAQSSEATTATPAPPAGSTSRLHIAQGTL